MEISFVNSSQSFFGYEYGGSFRLLRISRSCTRWSKFFLWILSTVLAKKISLFSSTRIGEEKLCKPLTEQEDSS